MNTVRWAAAVLVPALVAVAGDAAAQAVAHEPEEPNEAAAARSTDPLRGSIFVFEQSASTQAAHLEQPEQSYVPFYGWWLSLRPRWNFTDKLRVQARFDYYKEFTNSQTTTDRDEDVFDDIWTDLVYTSRVADHGPWSHTKWTLGARALWPTSKQSQGAGVYVTLGAFAGVSQDIPLRGANAPLFETARLGLRFGYLHPFSTATTPTSYGNFSYVRENVDDQSFVSDQISGQTLAAHELYSLAEGALQILPKLEFAITLVWIDQWHYPPPAATIPIGTGPTEVPRSDDNQFTQTVWDVFSLDYDLLPEVNLGLGYYNLTNEIAPDGTPRSLFGGGEHNVLWSPDARVFFDITANLDAIVEDATGKSRWGRGATSETARNLRAQTLAGAAAAPAH